MARIFSSINKVRLAERYQLCASIYVLVDAMCGEVRAIEITIARDNCLIQNNNYIRNCLRCIRLTYRSDIGSVRASKR